MLPRGRLTYLVLVVAIAAVLMPVLSVKKESNDIGGHAFCGHDQHMRKAKKYIREAPQVYDEEQLFNAIMERRDRADVAKENITRRDDSQEYAGGTQPIRINITFLHIDDRRCEDASDSVVVGSSTTATEGNCDPDGPTEDCDYDCEAADVLTSAKKKYLLTELLPFAKKFFEHALRVTPVNGSMVLSSGGCGADDVLIPGEYLGAGHPDTDFLLIVTARPTVGDVIAYASHCRVDQHKRPVAAYANFSPRFLDKLASEMLKTKGVAVHEITHALGFSESNMDKFRDPADVTQMTALPLSQVKETFTFAPGEDQTRSADRVITPNVVKQVKKQFACKDAAGGELEDGGGEGTAGSHWEKRVFGDEYMTGSAMRNPVYSAITLAFLEDAGWYTVNYDAAEASPWGRSEGCSFIDDICAKRDKYEYYCKDSSNTGCTYDRRAKGYCFVSEYSSIPAEYRQISGKDDMGGPSELADYCPYVVPYGDGYCDNSTLNEKDNVRGEQHASTARCFDSTLMQNKQEPDKSLKQGCYNSACTSSTNLKVKAGDFWYDCPEGKKLEPVTAKFSGYIQCPDDVEAVCATRSIDDNFCTFHSINPKASDDEAGKVLTIKGENFGSNVKVMIGDVECKLKKNDNKQIVCVMGDTDTLPGRDDFKVGVFVFNTDTGKNCGVEDAFLIETRNLITRIKDWVKTLQRITKGYFWVLVILICGIGIFVYYRKQKNKKKAKAQFNENELDGVATVNNAPRTRRGGGRAAGGQAVSRGNTPGSARRGSSATPGSARRGSTPPAQSGHTPREGSSGQQRYAGERPTPRSGGGGSNHPSRSNTPRKPSHVEYDMEEAQV